MARAPGHARGSRAKKPAQRSSRLAYRTAQLGQVDPGPQSGATPVRERVQLLCSRWGQRPTPSEPRPRLRAGGPEGKHPPHR